MWTRLTRDSYDWPDILVKNLVRYLLFKFCNLIHSMYIVLHDRGCLSIFEPKILQCRRSRTAARTRVSKLSLSGRTHH